MSVIAGLDVGGTKTHLRCLDEYTGEVVLEETFDSGDWANVSDTGRATRLAQMFAQRVMSTGASRAAAGVHGVDSPAQRQLLQAAVSGVMPGALVVNDAELIVPATGHARGTGLVCGTGSVATSTNGAGAPFTVGGWGWLLGDEGSGSAIVVAAAKAVLGAWDRQEKDQLSEALTSRLGIGHPHDLGHHLYSIDPSVWSRAAKVVFDAAAEGSTLAQGVIDQQVRALVNLVDRVRARGGHVGVIAVAGGVMRAQRDYFEDFAAAARSGCKGVDQVLLLTEPPVAGAIEIARRLGG